MAIFIEKNGKYELFMQDNAEILNNNTKTVMEELIKLWCKATQGKELEEYIEDIRRLYDYTMLMAKENEKLKQALKDTIESSKIIENEQKEENERLNNIINELEKWLKDYIKLFDKPDMLEEQTLEDLKEVLDKLQELKGSDKE